MYFELSPKTRIEDFYNYREELEKAKEAIFRERVIAIKGIRRVGKSSLMKVLSNEIELPFGWIDGRNVFSKDKMEMEIKKALGSLLWKHSIKERIKKAVKSIGIGGIEISIEEDVFSRLSTVPKGVLFVDEAQVMAEFGFDLYLAYLYDNFPNLTIVLAGSQIGLLEKLLGKGKKGNKGMRGRKVMEIMLKPLSKEKALSFLLEGFEQAKKEVELNELKEVVNLTGGLIGWLTLYGHERLYSSHEKAINYVKEKAIEVLSDELSVLLSHVKNKKAYITILKAISMGFNKWEEIYALLHKNKLKVGKGFVSKALAKLIDYSFVIKKDNKFYLSDPLISLSVREFSVS